MAGLSHRRFAYLGAGLTGILFAGVLFAQSHGDKEAKEDARRHRALAAVHETMAKCLESGKGEKVCMEQLRKDCKGLGIGKYCGLKHQH
jgi:hypothetical protein